MDEEMGISIGEIFTIIKERIGLIVVITLAEQKLFPVFERGQVPGNKMVEAFWLKGC